MHVTSPGDCYAIAISDANGRAYSYRRKDDGALSQKYSSSSSVSLTSGNWYEAKVVVDDDPNSSGQRLEWGRHPACQRVDTE